MWANRTKGRKGRKKLMNEVTHLRLASRLVPELRPAPASLVPCSVLRSGLSKVLFTTAARMSKADSYSGS